MQQISTSVDEWNAAYPVGTGVRYWPGARTGPGIEATTRSRASVLGGHTSVVWVTDVAGCIALSHVEPMATGVTS